MKTNNVKYTTENGTFYLDYSKHGMLTVEEQNINNIDGLLEDIKDALLEFKLSKKLTSKRISEIEKLLG